MKNCYQLMTNQGTYVLTQDKGLFIEIYQEYKKPLTLRFNETEALCFKKALNACTRLKKTKVKTKKKRGKK